MCVSRRRFRFCENASKHKHKLDVVVDLVTYFHIFLVLCRSTGRCRLCNLIHLSANAWVGFIMKNPIDRDLARFIRQDRSSPMKKNAFVRFCHRDAHDYVIHNYPSPIIPQSKWRRAHGTRGARPAPKHFQKMTNYF